MVDLRKLQGRDDEDIFIRKIGGMLCLVIHERDDSKAAALLDPSDIPALCHALYEAAGQVWPGNEKPTRTPKCRGAGRDG